MKNNKNSELNTMELINQETEMRNQQLIKQNLNQSHSSSNFIMKFFQIMNILISLLLGILCLIFYPDIGQIDKTIFYIIIFYMGISILCFFSSLTVIIFFWLINKIYKSRQQPQQIQQQYFPNYQNTQRSGVSAQDGEIYYSQLNNNYHNNNSARLSNLESEHSFYEFHTIHQNEVRWCNVGWFPLIYFSTLYIAYFIYLILSTKLIINSRDKVPLLVLVFLIYIWIVGFIHVLKAIILLFSKKFISSHIEEMEDPEVYKVDNVQINQKKQEIQNARRQNADY